MRNTIISISNVARLVQAYAESIQQNPALPKMVAVSGHAGRGKTKAVSFLSNQHNPLFLTANRFWSPNQMLRELISELGGRPSNGNGVMFKEIARRLRDQNRGVIIDEFDCLFGGRREVDLIDGVRQLHDEAGTPFVLVGEHDIRNKIAKYARLAGRIDRWLDFELLTISDGLLLAQGLVEGCMVEPDLASYLLERSRGLAREFCVLLNRAEIEANNRGLKTIGMHHWKQTAARDLRPDLAEASGS